LVTLSLHDALLIFARELLLCKKELDVIFLWQPHMLLPCFWDCCWDKITSINKAISPEVRSFLLVFQTMRIRYSKRWTSSARATWTVWTWIPCKMAPSTTSWRI